MCDIGVAFSLLLVLGTNGNFIIPSLHNFLPQLMGAARGDKVIGP